MYKYLKLARELKRSVEHDGVIGTLETVSKGLKSGMIGNQGNLDNY